MSDLKTLIAEVAAAEARGARFTCEFGTSRTAARQSTDSDIAARWAQAVDAAMIETRGNKPKAVARVVRKYPQLRAQLLQQANANRQQPITRQGAKPVSRATAKIDSEHFKQQLATLMEGGLSRRDAAKQLSQSMGLSQPRQEAPDSYWDQRKERYYS